MEVIIGENGDLVIPKGIFLQTHFKPGQKVKINIESGKIIITPNSDAIMDRFKELSQKISINHIDSDDIHEQMIQERFGTVLSILILTFLFMLLLMIVIRVTGAEKFWAI